MFADRNQVVLPLNLGLKIPKNDSVRKLVEICDSLDYSELEKAYLKHWRKHNPATLFTILVYAYMKGIYTSRKIEEACASSAECWKNCSDAKVNIIKFKSRDIFLKKCSVIFIVILRADNITDCLVVFINGNKAVIALFFKIIITVGVKNKIVYSFAVLTRALAVKVGKCTSCLSFS